MRAVVKNVLVFSLGVGVALTAFGLKGLLSPRPGTMPAWSLELDAREWATDGPEASEAFFAERCRIPLPQKIDLSTNAWQRLSYWQAFARAYQQAEYTNRVRRLRTVVPVDPWTAVEHFFPNEKPCGAEPSGPGGLAWKAAEMAKSGESFSQVVDWVAANAQYPTNRALFDSFVNMRYEWCMKQARGR